MYVSVQAWVYCTSNFICAFFTRAFQTCIVYMPIPLHAQSIWCTLHAISITCAIHTPKMTITRSFITRALSHPDFIRYIWVTYILRLRVDFCTAKMGDGLTNLPRRSDVLNGIIRSDKCHQRGATFKRFIVVVYRPLRHAANHINGNKQFNCCAAVYRPCFYFCEKCCWSVGWPRDERRPPGPQVLVDDAASAAGKSSSSSEADRPTPAPTEWLGKKSSRPAAHQPTSLARSVISDDFRRNFDLMVHSA